jgi:hypothetical protein
MDFRGDPSNLLGNANGGKQIEQQGQAAGSSWSRRLFCFAGQSASIPEFFKGRKKWN